MSSRFPAVVSCIIALPFDEVLILIAILTTAKDALNLIFKHIIDLNWGWRQWIKSIDLIAMPWGKMINMKDGVLVHRGWEAKTISKITCVFENVVRAKLSRGKFSTRMGDRDVFGREPNLLTGGKCVRGWFTGFKGLLYSLLLHSKGCFSIFVSFL